MEFIKQPTACVAFDGTIVFYDGYKGIGKFGDVLPGVKEALTLLKTQGWKIIVVTERFEYELIGHYLRENGIPYDEINRNSDTIAPGTSETKVQADVYIDSRAVVVPKGGDWFEVLANAHEMILEKGLMPRFKKE